MARAAQSSVIYGILAAALCVGVGGSAFADDARARNDNDKDRAAAAVGEALAPSVKKDIRPGLAGSFLSGRFARQNQDLKEAARYLKETLARDPENELLQQETMRMLVLSGDMASATDLAKKLDRAKNNEPLVASLLMLEAVRANDFTKAKSAIEQASTAGLFGLIRPVMVEWLALAEGQKKSVDLKAAIEKSGFFAPFLNYHSALMNDVLGNTQAAREAYAKANVDPSVTPYRVIEAVSNFEARQGKWAEAQAVYDAYAKSNPQSSLIPEKLVPGSAPKPLVGDAKQGLAELFFTTASILFGEEAAQDTFVYLRIALELRSDLPPAQLMLASLYEQLEDYKQAVATYEAIPEGSVFWRRAQVRKALNYEALGQKKEALALLEALAAKFPDDPTALITKADMERDAKNFAQAAETYSQAIARTEPLEAEDWPLLYARGISYERSGNWVKAEADLTRALELQPEQPEVLNYLGYSWLTMNKNIAKAREYLETAQAQRPDDPHIIDSVGWAYYLAGDFKGAVERFERAVELMPDDVTVNDHLGDAYWRVGRETEARYQWERALTFKPEKDVAEQLRDKLSNGMPDFVPAPVELNARKPETFSRQTAVPFSMQVH